MVGLSKVVGLSQNGIGLFGFVVSNVGDLALYLVCCGRLHTATDIANNAEIAFALLQGVHRNEMRYFLIEIHTIYENVGLPKGGLEVLVTIVPYLLWMPYVSKKA